MHVVPAFLVRRTLHGRLSPSNCGTFQASDAGSVAGNVAGGRLRLAGEQERFNVFDARVYRTRPSTSVICREHRAATCSSWVQITKVDFSSRLISRMSSSTCSAEFLSRFPVGSSARTSSGLFI